MFLNLACIVIAINFAGSSVARTLAPVSPSQQILQDTSSHAVMTRQCEKVPGSNSAYYTGSTPRRDQLFEIEEFTISPDPPLPERRFFGFLGGFMPEHVSNLNDSTLRFSLVKDCDTEVTSFQRKFADCEFILMRHNHLEYGHDLKPGRMEFLMDAMGLRRRGEAGTWTFGAEAKLPDERVLFAFAFDVIVVEEP